MGGQLGLLKGDGYVYIAHLVAFFLYERHHFSQQQLGVMSALSPEEGCLVEVYTETDFKRAEDLHAQLQEWLIKNGASQSAEVKIVLKQEK